MDQKHVWRIPKIAHKLVWLTDPNEHYHAGPYGDSDEFSIAPEYFEKLNAAIKLILDAAGLNADQADQCSGPVVAAPPVQSCEPCSLQNFVVNYYIARGLQWPTLDQALQWHETEMGEVYEILLARVGGWVRNDPTRERPSDSESLATELGDAIMMLLVAGIVAGVNPLEALRKKMERKIGRVIDASATTVECSKVVLNGCQRSDCKHWIAAGDAHGCVTDAIRVAVGVCPVASEAVDDYSCTAFRVR